MRTFIVDFLERLRFRLTGRPPSLATQVADVAPHFDAEYYLSANSDVASAGCDPVRHYFDYGWREGRDPSPFFSTRNYLAAHPELAESGVNPYWHFIWQNPSGRPVAPILAESDVDSRDNIDEVEQKLRQTAAAISGLFDPVFYLEKYQDVAKSGVDPLRHYCDVGWQEGRDPGPNFSTSYYLASNPDIARAGVNPYWHYVVAGRAEGRLPTHPGGWQHRVLSQQRPLVEVLRAWKVSDEPDLLNAAELSERARQAPGGFGAHVVVSVGHDDYRSTPGGVQLCIQLEQEQAIARGASYFNLNPWQPLPTLAPIETDPAINVILDGQSLGTAPMSEVVTALGAIGQSAGRVDLFIHHLAGHSAEQIADLAGAMGVGTCHLWLHDFFTICTSFALQRNNVAFCGAPAPTSNACRICIFGEERQRHVARISDFFTTLEIDVISPSKAALDLWTARSGLSARSASIRPHMSLTTVPAPERSAASDGPIRIAFVGTPASHKGWPVYCDLYAELQGDDRFELWAFGVAVPGMSGIHHVPVRSSAENRGAMAKALAAHDIDLVFNWSRCVETFSFTTFEALEAGAFVITNAGSGNIAAAIWETGCGVVLKDEAAFFAWVTDGGLEALASAARAHRSKTGFRVLYSSMSFAPIQDLVAE